VEERRVKESRVEELLEYYVRTLDMTSPRTQKHGGVYRLLFSYYFLIIIHVCTSTDNLVAPIVRKRVFLK
jgi:hypothetical protein